MIELFARKPAALDLSADAGLTPIPVDEAVVSLSAILMDENYYEALLAEKRQLEGVTIIDETLLIPFKARAYLDLAARVRAGEKVDSKTIKKHRGDVFRLAQLLPTGRVIALSDPIRQDLRAFLTAVGDDKTLNPRDFDVPFSRDEAVELIRTAYGLA